jgi:2-polyprenyl-3-methyl-5-hydroxy-6-metoxy-1,4-benzoquinol methylase
MKEWLLPLLVCPKTGESLELHDVQYSGQEIISGCLSCRDMTYPIVNGIPRFTPNQYAKGFALQWTQHDVTQIDNRQHQHSAGRFWGETGLTPEILKGSLVIDGGCGAGRFANIAGGAGARVVAIDLSEAVEACQRNTEHLDVSVVQASLFELPFRKSSFDHGFSIGVIQHTPDPLRALRGVAELIRPGGEFGVSWYKLYWYTYFHQKYILRPIFQEWDEVKLYNFVSWYVPKLLPLSRLLTHILPDSLLKTEVVDRILPVANRDRIEGLSEQQKLEWAILDTYDWFNPRYDKPQTWRAVELTMRNLGYECERAPLHRRGLHCVRRSP